METSAKRRKSAGSYVTVEEKLRTVERLKTGINIMKLAEEVGVEPGTIRRWRRTASELSKVDKTKKTCRKPNLAELDDRMYEWAVHQRSLNNDFTQNQLKAQALAYNNDMGGPEDFQASDGWCTRFVQRHGLHNVEESGVQLPADKSSAEAFVHQLKDKMQEEDFHPEDVYNFDESVLFFRALPNAKVDTERVTLGVCANATGSHKLPLLVIGTTKKPQCFRNSSEIARLPVKYVAHRKSRMTKDVFMDWMLDVFIPGVEIYHRGLNRYACVLLLVTNAASHQVPERYTRGRYVVWFLPPNTTSLIQPMDQGVITKLKRAYRRCLVERILKSTASDNEFCEEITVKDACVLSHEAWESVKPLSIKRAWRKLIPDVDVDDPLTTERTPSPSTSEDAEEQQDIVQLVRTTAKGGALTNDNVWAWFKDVETAEHDFEAPEDVSEQEDGSDDEDHEEEGLSPSTEEWTWAQVKTFALRNNLNDSVRKIEDAIHAMAF